MMRRLFAHFREYR